MALIGLILYASIAMLLSLAIPIRRGPSVYAIQDAGPGERVIIGLAWPLFVIIWVRYELR